MATADRTECDARQRASHSRLAEGECTGLEPLFVARLGALPIEYTLSLRSSALSTALEECEAAAAYLDRTAEAAAPTLHARVGASTDQRERSALIRWRRLMFNRRSPGSADVKSITMFDSSVQALLQDYRDVLTDRDRAVASVERAYFAALNEGRWRLREAIRASAFQDGLLLSSPTLFRNLRRYSNAVGMELGSRDSQIERGVLKYLTRASMKATPFASFCTIACGRLVADASSINQAHEWYRPVGSFAAVRRVARPNKLLYAKLWASLKASKQYRPFLVVELNATINEEQDRLTFLCDANGRELFQRLDSNQTLRWIISHSRRRGPLQMRRLVEELISAPELEATSDEALAYVEALTRIGLLRYRQPVPAQEANWVDLVCQLLESMELEAAKELVEPLRSLREYSTAFTTSSSAHRAEITEAARESVAQLWRALSAPPDPPNTVIFYEDQGTDAELNVVSSAALQNAARDAHRMLSWLLQVAPWRADMATMRHAFEQCYGLHTESVPLLRFYEDYYRSHYKQHLERTLPGAVNPSEEETPGTYKAENPFSLPYVDDLITYQRAITRHLASVIARDPWVEELVFASSELPAVPSGLARALPSPLSASIFCQLISPCGTAPLRILASNLQSFLGFGKYFSRFLSVLPEATTSEILDRNAHYSGVLLAEIAGDANFNANLHPPILPWRVDYPTGDAEPEESAISADEIDVRVNPDDPRDLVLVHAASGCRIFPLDLGFLNPRMRPPLYQLLGRFGPVQGQAMIIPIGTPRKLKPDDQFAIMYRPRLVCDATVVLSRRQWAIPSPLIPFREKTESGAEYLMRVRSWRLACGMPREVYIRVRVDASAQRQNSRKASKSSQGADENSVALESSTVAASIPVHATEVEPKSSRDLAKPQYIDFESPLLLELFTKLRVDGSQFTMHIEERYPDTHSLPEIDGKRHAVELVMQFTLND